MSEPEKTVDGESLGRHGLPGNLTLDEQRLLENSLTELRFRYIQAVEESKKK